MSTELAATIDAGQQDQLPGYLGIKLVSASPDEVMVSADNLAPTADAGADQLVSVGETAFLDGSGSSDPYRVS